MISIEIPIQFFIDILSLMKINIFDFSSLIYTSSTEIDCIFNDFICVNIENINENMKFYLVKNNNYIKTNNKTYVLKQNIEIDLSFKCKILLKNINSDIMVETSEENGIIYKVCKGIINLWIKIYNNNRVIHVTNESIKNCIVIRHNTNESTNENVGLGEIADNHFILNVKNTNKQLYMRLEEPLKIKIDKNSLEEVNKNIFTTKRNEINQKMTDEFDKTAREVKNDLNRLEKQRKGSNEMLYLGLGSFCLLCFISIVILAFKYYKTF